MKNLIRIASLVMILVLLITSLMTVVGAFLMTSVTNFYINDFYSQMQQEQQSYIWDMELPMKQM